MRYPTTPWAGDGQRSIVQLGGGINMLHLEYRSLLEFKRIATHSIVWFLRECRPDPFQNKLLHDCYDQECVSSRQAKRIVSDLNQS